MHIVFVHTPMATVEVPQRENFWRHFDARYHAAHPNLRPMENVLWELPHWMHWLGGVLMDRGYTSLQALSPYASACTMDGIDYERTKAALEAAPADLYLFSPMIPNLPFALEIAQLAKTLHPNSKTVFGGVAATPLRREIASHPAVDFVVFGRGEYALPTLVDCIVQGGDFDEVRNLARKLDSGELYISPFEYPWMPVRDIPPPKIDLFPSEVGRDIRYLRQVYALGCPYRCSFCTIQTIGQKADYFPIDRVVSEIRRYKEHYGNHHNIYFGDETFTVNSERTLDICKALAEEGNVSYDIQTRLNLLNDETVLNALKTSGCKWVEIGIESINQDTQDRHKQRSNLRVLEDSLKRVRDAGLPTCAFMVNGFPNQTLSDMRHSIDQACLLIERDLLHASYLFGLVPYPGSSLFDAPESFDMKILHRDFRLYHEDLPPVYETPFATSDQIFEVFLEGVEQLASTMAGPSSFLGLSSRMDRSSFGSFWQGSHV